jgi:cytidylate kinase
MLNEKKFIKSQKECADMLGMSLEEYNEYLEKAKVNNDKIDNKIDNSFLKYINIKESQLKSRKD